ncbi:cAMP-dependent protein kinase type II regulatory subunit-like protein [Leptotrombidium deliense]|uniref:cAMP-dependent protein kinase type II regulatory subunit n=1 Tax=Leptotrombidium deliense TaxID=299467 RepID=A0A443SVV6_9ACAR|nr:cAMP-dependent protein kinase type II regulatory subunit-like protein [Leptotrombidium deliense]
MNRNTRLEVPPELTNLLLDFTISVLVNKPSNLVEYASEYFTRLLNERRNANISSGSSQGGENHLNDNHFGDDENEDSLSSDFKPPMKLSFNRRKSVFAEHYDPAEDEDDNEKIVYPKSDEQRRRLGEAIKTILLFRSLDAAEMSEVLDAMFERKVEEGDMVIRQGDDGDYFYVIEKGTFQFFIDDNGDEKVLGEYTDSGSFGELALMYNMPRSASVRARSKGSLWAMSRHTFRKIVLKRAFLKRKIYEELLEKVEMLKSLESYERMNLCDALTPKRFADGDLIIKEGDEADGMYFIEQGTVRVTKTNENGEQREISRLTKGGYFGELALITHKQRAASVYAEGEVKAAFLDVGAFERLLGPCMDIMKRNFNDYEEQLVKIFGSKANISDLR